MSKKESLKFLDDCINHISSLTLEELKQLEKETGVDIMLKKEVISLLKNLHAIKNGNLYLSFSVYEKNKFKEEITLNLHPNIRNKITELCKQSIIDELGWFADTLIDLLDKENKFEELYNEVKKLKKESKDE